jgi:predicted polyphosphate/ATP-dependent NAD kinase
MPGGKASSASVIGPVGIVVNPASGKDIRRLVAKASVFDNQEKKAIVRRAITGVVAAGVCDFRYVPDSNEIAEAAIAEVEQNIRAEAVACAETRSVLDTITGAEGLKEAGCCAVISLGGDGTNRALVKGWRHAPLIPISTGTNNAFPVLVEATIAGAAAGLVASGQVAMNKVASQAKVITVKIENEVDDLALIDAVFTSDRFIGARALLDSDRLRMAMLTLAEPASVGIASIGGLIQPVSRSEDQGLLLSFGSEDKPGIDNEKDILNRVLMAPIAPGFYQKIRIRSALKIPFGETVDVVGPGTLALDGERERVLKPGQTASLSVRRDGPWVIDVQQALASGAEQGAFWEK